MADDYVTAEDVGMSVADMIEVRRQTSFVAGLPVEGAAVGGDPGPHTSLGVFLGLKAAVKRALGKDSLAGLHIALQGAGSVATGVAMHAAAEGARISVADVDAARAKKLAADTGGAVVDPDEILTLEADVFSPNALGAILTEQSIAELNAPIVAGGANNQLATDQDGDRLMERGILYAPDYVINAGGIINVSSEYLGEGDAAVVRSRIEAIPGRLEEIWAESQSSGRNPAAVADSDGAAPDRAWPLGARCARDLAMHAFRQSRPLPARSPGPATGWLLAIGLALAAAGIIGGLTLTPPDYLQGETVRILYIHVPAAWLGMAGWAGIAAASISQLVWRHPLAAVAGRAIAPAGATFAALCLATGSIWGRPSVGHLVGMGRAADLDADPVVPLPRLHRARCGRARAGRGGRLAASVRPGRGDQPADHPLFGLWWRTLHQGQSITITRLDHRAVDAMAAAADHARLHGDIRRRRADADAGGSRAHQARGAVAPGGSGMNPWPFVAAAYAADPARDRGAGPAVVAIDAHGRGRRRATQRNEGKPKHQRLVLVSLARGRDDRRGAARDVGPQGPRGLFLHAVRYRRSAAPRPGRCASAGWSRRAR